MGVKIIHNERKFIDLNTTVMDSALERMANDMIMMIFIYIPFLSGDMQKEVDRIRLETMRYRVRVNKEYAGYQERGMRRDGSHAVKKYSTPGTGKDFVKRSGRNIASNVVNYLKQANALIRFGL